MTILVTGAAGFIGSHLIDALLAGGQAVIGLDNLNSYYSPQQKQRNIEHQRGNKNFTFYLADITNREHMEDIFRTNHINKVVHLAARAGVRPSLEQAELYTRTNTLGTIYLLELAVKYKVQKFVFSSSSSVYGANSKVPFCEKDPVDEPLSPYAASKRAAEIYCSLYSRRFHLPVACLRFFTVYGPRGRPDMAPYLFTEKILAGEPITRFGEGTSGRDYTYVADVVDGLIATLQAPLDFEIINLGNSCPVLLNDLIKMIEELVDRKAIIEEQPRQPGDVIVTHADISKAQKLLKYQPRVPLKEGLRRFVEWYRANFSAEKIVEYR